MRVTENIIARNIVKNFQQGLSSVAEAQIKVASGRAFQKPSDDPVKFARSLDLGASRKQLVQYQRNADEALVWMEITLSKLDELRDIISKARVEAVKGATSTIASEAREASAQNIASLRDKLLDVANAKVRGLRVFGGTKTTTDPFDATGTYSGDTGQIKRSIGEGISVTVNANGTDVFKTGADIFSTLSSLESALRSDDIQGINAQIANLDLSSDNVLQRVAFLGADVQRVESEKSRLGDTELTILELLSENEDVDLAEAVVELQTLQNSFQASADAGTQILQQSLLRFLR